MRRVFVVTPERCLSTHGGGGYTYGSFYEDGKIVCGLCGTRCDTQSTANIPEFIAGVPYALTKEGKKDARRAEKRWWEVW